MSRRSAHCVEKVRKPVLMKSACDRDPGSDRERAGNAPVQSAEAATKTAAEIDPMRMPASGKYFTLRSSHSAVKDCR